MLYRSYYSTDRTGFTPRGCRYTPQSFTIRDQRLTDDPLVQDKMADPGILVTLSLDIVSFAFRFRAFAYVQSMVKLSHVRFASSESSLSDTVVSLQTALFLHQIVVYYCRDFHGE